MTLEQILFLLIFLLIPVLNFLARALRRHVWPPAPEDEAPPGRSPEPAPRASARPTPPPRVRERPREVPPLAPPAAAPAPRSKRARLDTGDVRRAIVLMAILGPCQGVEPPATRR